MLPLVTNAQERQTKAQRQNAAREKARVMREEAKKKARRNKILLQSGIGVGILAVLAIVAIVIVNVARPTSNAGPKNMISDGFLMTSTTEYVSTPAIPHNGKPTPTKQPDDGKAHITIYEDLQCPVCQAFEEGNDEQIAQWLDAGTATLEIHPISFLDSSSLGNRYSSRAASAIGCVAQYAPSKFFAVNKAFYDNQPAENTHGKTDAEILATIKQGGASSSQITSCVKDERFKGWVQQTYQRTMTGKSPIPNSNLKQITGTPTVIVNGKQFNANGSIQWNDTASFLSFVQSTVDGWSPDGSGATPTPTATPAG
jgi:protein-disulfide isomerase